MITVRFPTGFSIQYNDGHYVDVWVDGRYRICDKKGGTLIAHVPAECVVEWVQPCRMYNPLDDRKAEHESHERRLAERRQRAAKRRKR
jgi:hypothetical protein